MVTAESSVILWREQQSWTCNSFELHNISLVKTNILLWWFYNVLPSNPSLICSVLPASILSRILD